MVPPWAAAILYPDAAVAHAHDLGSKSGDAVFLVFVERAMPLGTVGLLMAGMFSATMASMDAALNHNAGIFVRSFYQPVIRGARALSERESVLAGKGMNVINGLVIIVIALGFSHLKGLSLFTLMMRVGTLATLPIVVPLFLGLLIRRVPDWAGWATLAGRARRVLPVQRGDLGPRAEPLVRLGRLERARDFRVRHHVRPCSAIAC